MEVGSSPATTAVSFHVREGLLGFLEGLARFSGAIERTYAGGEPTRIVEHLALRRVGTLLEAGNGGLELEALALHAEDEGPLVKGGRVGFGSSREVGGQVRLDTSQIALAIPSARFLLTPCSLCAPPSPAPVAH